MLERILNFLKNKYFIGTVVLLFVIAIVVLVINFLVVKVIPRLIPPKIYDSILLLF